MSKSKSLPPVGYAKDPPAAEVAAQQVRLDLKPKFDAKSAFESRQREVLRLAEEAFAMTGRWVVFYRTMLGIDGLVAELFPDPAERQRFFQTESHAELQEMIAAMRSTDQSKSDATEPERMITIRIPMTLHEVLMQEAEAAELSINRLCISKLIQPVQDRHVPEPQGRRRGRKPGPQGSRK